MKLTFYTIMKQEDFGTSIRFPDFEDCVTFGDDAEDAVTSAEEVLSAKIYDMIKDGEDLPTPLNPDDIQLGDKESLVDVTVSI